MQARGDLPQVLELPDEEMAVQIPAPQRQFSLAPAWRGGALHYNCSKFACWD